MATAVFKIHGMDCAEEVAALRSVLAPMAGVGELAFDVLNGKLTIDFADGTVTPAALVAGIAKTGMRAEPWRESVPRLKPPSSSVQWGRAASTAISGALIAAGFVVHGLADGWHAAITGSDGSFATSPVPTLLYLAAAIAGGWFVVPKAWRALLRLRPDMNLLMTVAVVGAILIQQYFEAATVAFLFALSLLLESWSVGRARNAVAALMSLTPPTARVADSTGREVMTDVREVPLGSRVVVLPGEKIPLDGTLTKGETTVDQAPITGESVPVAKSPGSEVFAGTINQDGAIELVTTKPASDTTLARVIRMVGEARSKRSPSEQWVERFARIYTPAVMALAVAVMVLPPLVGGGSWSRWFYEGLVLLVIACPCALRDLDAGEHRGGAGGSGAARCAGERWRVHGSAFASSKQSRSTRRARSPKAARRSTRSCPSRATRSWKSWSSPPLSKPDRSIRSPRPCCELPPPAGFNRRRRTTTRQCPAKARLRASAVA